MSISRLNTLAKNLKFRRGNRNVLIETYLGKIEKGEEEPTSFEIIRHQYQIPKERKDILFLHNSLQLHIDCPGFNLLQKLAFVHGKANRKKINQLNKTATILGLIQSGEQNQLCSMLKLP